MKVVLLTVLVVIGDTVALRISNNLPMNSVLPSSHPLQSNLWPPPPDSNLQCQCTCEPSSNPGNHIYVSGDINIEPNRAQTTYTSDVTTTSFLTQTPVVLSNVEITHIRPVTDTPHQEQAVVPMTTISAPPNTTAPAAGKTSGAGAKPLSKGLLLRDRLRERRNRRIMLEQFSIRGNPPGFPRGAGTRYGVPLRDQLKAIPETTTDRNTETRTENTITKSSMTGNGHTNGNGNGSNSGSSDGKVNRNGNGNSNGNYNGNGGRNGNGNGNDNGNGDRNGNGNGNGEGNRSSHAKVNGKTSGNGNERPSGGNKNENKSSDSNVKAGRGSNRNSKQGETRKQNNDNYNGNTENNGSTSYKHVDGSGSNDKNDSVSAKDKMIIDLLQKLASQTANNNNNNANNNNNNANNNNNVGGRISERWQGGQANTGWNKAPSTYPPTTTGGFGIGVGFGMPPMMGMGMGDWIPSF